MSFTFTIGCDPEIFVKKNGVPFSAHGLCEGTKENPQKTPDGAIQVDGLALELNTDPVTKNDFVSFNAKVISQIRFLRSILPEGMSLSIEPVQEFSKEHLDEQPDEAKELGCDPDYNAYTMNENPRPDADDVLFRTGAGHIHIGWGADIPIDNPEHMEICASFVKMMDCTVGMFMTCIDREPRRRELYGKAGAFRPKSYGVEYRTPSNVWLKNKMFRKMVFELTNLAISLMQGGKFPVDRNPYQAYGVLTDVTVEDIINNGNHALASEKLLELLRYVSPRLARSFEETKERYIDGVLD